MAQRKAHARFLQYRPYHVISAVPRGKGLPAELGWSCICLSIHRLSFPCLSAFVPTMSEGCLIA
jgi:hypothetical protein